MYQDYTELEKSTFQWHIANLEYACAAELSDISLRHWDQVEPFSFFHSNTFPFNFSHLSLLQDDQYDFEGDHCLLQRGYGSVLGKLAEGLDVRYNHPVKSIHYTENSVTVIL